MANLLEVVTSSAVKVDREAGIIHGVRILGSESRNGREYSKAAIAQAKPLYEGRVVNVGHPSRSNPGAERSVDDRIGWLSNVREENNGLTGDLNFLKSDPRAEKICEAAERNPALFGLSHNAEGRVVRNGAKFLVEQIEAVRSVDIVSDPATTRSLFESFERSSTMDGEMAAAPPVDGDITLTMFHSKVDEIYNGEGDAKTKAKAIGEVAKKLLKIKEELDAATAKAEEKPAEKPAEPTVESLQAEVKTLKDREEVRQLFESAGVKPSEIQAKAVLGLASKEDRQALIESYKPAQAKGKDEKPKSASPLLESKDAAKTLPKDSKEFARALTR